MIHERGYWLSQEPKHFFDVTLAEELIELFRNRTVWDVGCGFGDYVEFFRTKGIDCKGIEGNPTIVGSKYFTRDLSEPIDLPARDVVLCLEVGEHIPVQYEQTFLDNISKLATKRIIMSWAIPGQEGTGHVNEQPVWFIADQMVKRGWQPHPTTFKLRATCSLLWLRNSLTVYDKM